MLALRGSLLLFADAINLAGKESVWIGRVPIGVCKILAPEYGAQNFNSRVRGANRPCTSFLQTEILQRKKSPCAATHMPQNDEI